MDLTFLCDRYRHLVCLPYSIGNLHLMAESLGIKRCWFHSGRLAHYDIPKRRIAEITGRCLVVDAALILGVIKGEIGIADIPAA